MKKQFALLTGVMITLLFSCKPPDAPPAAAEQVLVYRFELDSLGNIQDEEVKRGLIELARSISKNADRVMLTAYSEQTGNAEKNRQIAFDMANAAKLLMLKNAERAYYNVGVTIVGYGKPVNPAKPADMQNRRIEFTYMR